MHSLIAESKKAGIVPVPGCELYMAPENPDGAKCRQRVFYGTEEQRRRGDDVSSNGAYTHLTVWAHSMTGLRNLYRLSLIAHENVYVKPRVDLDILSAHSDGLIVATGCPSSELSTRLRLGQSQEAMRYIDRMVEVFGNRLFFEVMAHDMDLEKRLIAQQMPFLQEARARHGAASLPLLATNDAHYVEQADAGRHKEMLCVSSSSSSNPVTMFDKPEVRVQRFGLLPAHCAGDVRRAAARRIHRLPGPGGTRRFARHHGEVRGHHRGLRPAPPSFC